MLLSHVVPMSFPLTSILQQQSRVLLSALPTGTAATAAAGLFTAATSTTSTRLSLAASCDSESSDSVPNNSNSKNSMIPWPLPPRAVATIYMAWAMALHFGGYEFIRNSCLSLFTSSETGFSSAAAFPLANGLISPFSVLLLWGYSHKLEQAGPRVALRTTTACSIVFIVAVTAALHACQHAGLPRSVSKALVGLAFLFQSSYQHLLYTQQWSFVGSVVTPQEGALWFAVLAGCSSLFCSFMGSLVPIMLPYTGLLGLMGLTAVTLTGSLLCADRAYALSEQHGFDPSQQQKQHQKQKQQKQNQQQATGVQQQATGVQQSSPNRFSQAVELFGRVPILGVLFAEVLSFQSLNTILNVAFMRSLKADIVNDQLRAAYTGKFYAAINAVSALLQFVAVPLFLKHTEPALIWRLMPLIPLAVCLAQVVHGQLSLTLLAAAFFSTKVMDYAVRSVLSISAYQPLDFESRFMGKEINGIFGSRFGKSGMSLILSGLTMVGLTGQQQLGQLSLLASLTWMSSTWWLSRLLPSKKDAQAQVERRKQVVVDDAVVADTVDAADEPIKQKTS